MSQRVIILVVFVLVAVAGLVYFNENKPPTNTIPSGSKAESSGGSYYPLKTSKNVDTSQTKQSSSESADTENEKNDVLFTEFLKDGREVEIIAVEYLKNGDIATETRRYPDGSIAIRRFAYEEDRETGYNFHPIEHPYSEYDKDILRQMAEQNDNAALYILAFKEKSKDLYLKAAERGYTYGFLKAAQIMHGSEPKIDVYAMYLLAEHTGPKEDRRSKQIMARKLELTTQEIAIAKQRFKELKLQYNVE